jgi:hypothetical protein
MNPLFKFSPIVLLGLLLAGCGGSPQSVATRGAKAFQSAPPETKAAWDAAIAAIKTNGYTSASLALQQLMTQPGLTPQQTRAAQETGTALSDQMYEAANKGDANAKQAIDELRKLRGR